MCGFVGIIGVENAAASLFMALQAVQHRGQDAAGIGTWNNGYIHVHKDIGMVSQALPAEAISVLEGGSGIGHVRYPTAGSSTASFTQRAPAFESACSAALEVEPVVKTSSIRRTRCP